MAVTANWGIPLLDAAVLSRDIVHNMAVRYLDLLVQAHALDRLNTAPVSPADGATYIVTAGSPSGDDFDGHDDEIAYFLNTAWLFIPTTEIEEGFMIYVRDEALWYSWNGTAWTNAPT